jgi:hypothetical protein
MELVSNMEYLQSVLNLSSFSFVCFCPDSRFVPTYLNNEKLGQPLECIPLFTLLPNEGTKRLMPFMHNGYDPSIRVRKDSSFATLYAREPVQVALIYKKREGNVETGL